ncbi:MAG: hypothetical protein KIT31_16260 [Deltaproteobacteria bacterium]|nr:hypothetical protein [Deltaproteobacteria bacterium]
MSEMAIESRSSTSGGGSAQPATPKANTALSTTDHTKLVDLLLQETAMVARETTLAGDTKELVRGTTRALGHSREVIDSVAVRESDGFAAKQVFRSLDAAFMALFDLHQVLSKHTESAVSKHAPSVQDALIRLNHCFAQVGWNAPKGSDEGHARMAEADKVGALHLSNSEKGELGRLHLRAARQHLLGGWPQVIDGALAAVASDVTRELRAAAALLLDPRLASEMRSVATELELTEQVLERVVLHVEANDRKGLTALTDLAAAIDVLLKLTERPGVWAARIAGTSPSPVGLPAPRPVAVDRNGVPATHSNEIDKGPPRAEPAMHRSSFTNFFTRKVHLKDTHLIDEYLGYVELSFEIVHSTAGQIYATDNTTIRPVFEGRAVSHLNASAEIHGGSWDLKGERYATVDFLVHIGGPIVTTTSTAGGGAELSSPGAERGIGVKANATWAKSVGVVSKGAKSFRRAYRIDAMAPTQITLSTPDGSTRKETVGIGVPMVTRQDDLGDFDIADNGGGWFDGKWTIHSYSED